MSNPMINKTSLVKPHWNQDDVNNAEAVLEFVQLLMNDHNFNAITDRYKGKPYKQHNRNIADNIEGVVKAVGDLVKNAPEFSYDVKQVHVDGEHVILHSHATLKKAHRGDDSQGLNIMDSWKVVDGKLVEHWDAVQGISGSMRLYGLFTGGKVRNDNGVF
ncbi:nuclear transport factor 2 family protein [uncultured Vibrio sp.]|uniref:nuclear transport factor 2 family protein n=1 Tax=uncultured Vibrio sp. TaxID=114054 RepID=UPI0025DE9867|nr:nuclear transport factor 2 family protein [uncultured Vibrio sp.]